MPLPKLKVTRISCYFCIIALANTALIDVNPPNDTVNPFLKTETETPDNECIADPCLTLGKQCQNDGECVTDPTTCKSKCVCTKGYYGGRCQYETDKRNSSEDPEHTDMKSATPKTTTTVADCSGKVCLHGECVPAAYGTTICQCNDGWFGETCGTFGAVIDDDFLKTLTESFHEKLSKMENKNRFHTDEGDRHPKNMSDFVMNGMDIFRKPSNHSKTDLAPKYNNNNTTHVPLQSSEPSLQSDPNESTDPSALAESLVTEENESVIGDNFQKYNVCSEEYIERTEEESTCEHALEGVKCVHGICNETEVDHGTWTGYETECICDFGSTGMFCERQCCLNCGENGKCDHDNGTDHCNCRRQYTGFFCEIFVPDPVSIQVKEDTWYMWVVGVCVGTFVILVTMAVVGPYFMWKHRVILVMKIVHYFQAYEDDDEKEWDAFVSYKSHPMDENFVVRVLYPKLEKELGFKLCLHFRDFVPGETISNNIINAVEGSRRTILVLTPRYVESEFTRFEYQKAQTEMLKRKHRIIPIMLEDISDVSDIDKNLKGIIGSVTYLEWPGNEDSNSNSKKLDKFWKRLQLSLPKKKVSDCEKSLLSSPISPVVTSLSPSGKTVSVSSDRDSGFKGSVTSDQSRGSTASENIENWWVSDSTYAQIGDVFCDDISESVQPLTEEEELELIAKGSKQANNGDKLTYDYVDMEHDRYVEFKPEDNPPSARLVRKMQQEKLKEFAMKDNNMTASIVKKELPENYIEFKLEGNSRPTSIVKKELPENYIEFELEENSRPASIVKKELPENYIEFELEENSRPASIVKKELPENYIEFELEENSLPANIVKKDLPENYIEFKVEDILPKANIKGKQLLKNEFKMEVNSPPSSLGNDELPENYIEFKAEDNPPSPSLLRNKYPVVQLDVDGYMEVDV